MKSKLIILFTVLVFSFLFLTLPEDGIAGTNPNIGCCQFLNPMTCSSIDPTECSLDNGTFFPGQNCNFDTGSCIGRPILKENVPTLSEWGLVAMAGILGLVGFMVIRRRKAAA